MSHCFSSPPPPPVYSLRLFYFLISLFLPKFIWMRIETKHGMLYFGKQYYFMINLKAIFLYTYWIASSGITKIYIFSKYFWSPCSTDENYFDFVFLLGSLTTSIWYHVDVLLKTCSSVKQEILKFGLQKNSGDISCQIWFFFSWVRLADTIFHKNRTTG